MSTAHIPTEPPKKITFIGPEGKSIWIGTEKGLRNEYPFALIKKIEEKMKYKNLKNGQKIEIKIEDRFFKMEISKCAIYEDGFTISNYGFKEKDLVHGHEKMWKIKNQKQLDLLDIRCESSIT